MSEALDVYDGYDEEPFEWAQREWPRPWIPRFLELIAAGASVTDACRETGISRGAAYSARNGQKERPTQNAKSYPPVPGFLDAWQEAIERSIDTLERTAFMVAGVGLKVTVTKTLTTMRDGKPVTETTVIESTHRSDQVLLRTLEARRAAVWARRVDHTIGGDPDRPIQHEVGPRRRSQERVRALLGIEEEQASEFPAVIEGHVVDESNGDGTYE